MEAEGPPTRLLGDEKQVRAPLARPPTRRVRTTTGMLFLSATLRAHTAFCSTSTPPTSAVEHGHIRVLLRRGQLLPLVLVPVHPIWAESGARVPLAAPHLLPLVAALDDAAARRVYPLAAR